MVYYPNHGKSRVKITKADYNVLGEHEMLNDSAIDFYLKWIEHEVVVKCSTVANQFLFFGTFFFKKMMHLLFVILHNNHPLSHP